MKYDQFLQFPSVINQRRFTAKCTRPKFFFHDYCIDAYLICSTDFPRKDAFQEQRVENVDKVSKRRRKACQELFNSLYFVHRQPKTFLLTAYFIQLPRRQRGSGEDFAGKNLG